MIRTTGFGTAGRKRTIARSRITGGRILRRWIASGLAHEALARGGHEGDGLREEHAHRVTHRDRLLVGAPLHLHLGQRRRRQLNGRVQRQSRELLSLRVLNALGLLLGELTKAAEEILRIAAQRKAEPAFAHTCRLATDECAGGDVGCRLLHLAVRRLRAPVGVQDPRLPPAEVRLVEQLEVEERADVRLAVREPDRRAEAHALLQRVDGADVLAPAVERPLRLRRSRLVPRLEPPDRDAAGARKRLRGPAEGCCVRRLELAEIALADRSAAGMRLPRWFGVRVRIGMVPDRVEDSLSPAARAERRAQAANEVGRRHRRAAAAARGRGRADHVHPRLERVQDVPAAREQRLVPGRRDGPPEERTVGLVPHDDVVDGRELAQDVAGEAAELVAAGGGLRRVGRPAADREHDAEPPGRRDRARQRKSLLTTERRLAALPPHADSDRAEPESLRDRERRSRPRRPRRGVVGDADQQAAIRGSGRRDDEREQHGEQKPHAGFIGAAARALKGYRGSGGGGGGGSGIWEPPPELRTVRFPISTKPSRRTTGAFACAGRLRRSTLFPISAITPRSTSTPSGTITWTFPIKQSTAMRKTGPLRIASRRSIVELPMTVIAFVCSPTCHRPRRAVLPMSATTQRLPGRARTGF